MEPPKEIYLIRDAANPKKILGDIASEKPMFSDDIKYIRADLVKLSTNGTEWGAEHRGSSEIPNNLEEAAEKHLDTVFGKGKHQPFYKVLFIAGGIWQRQQMLKEAVEGEFLYTPYPTISLDDSKDYNFKDNQKVRIIIVKE